jgi:bis(5'-nucleosyl)-tetraphosphatase (symmetrical)
MATYIIGDIQGCYDPLRRVLDKAGFQRESDQLWAVGDLINRGPDSLGVARFLHALGPSFLSVLGNHDLHFLAVAHGYRKPRKKDTLDALLAAADRQELVTWFQSFPLAFYRQGTLVVHAGVPPTWTLEETLARALEVENWLRGPNFGDFLGNMYGNTPDHFAKDQLALVRARTITNALTRMRFCTADDAQCSRLGHRLRLEPNINPIAAGRRHPL